MKPISWIRTTFLKRFVYYPQICDVKRSDAQHTGQTVQRKQKTHSSSSCQQTDPDWLREKTNAVPQKR